MQTNLPYPYQSLKLVREDSQHWWFHCVFHKGDSEPSMVVNKTDPYRLWYRCWACNANGSPKYFATHYLGHDPKLIDSQIEPCSDAITILKERYKMNWETKRGCPLNHIPDEEKRLAEMVGVSVETIRKFSIGIKDDKYLIPMYDENGICGISTRFYEFNSLVGWVCEKRCIKGSHHGWFAPANPIYRREFPTFITEGWSDTAIILEMGFQAMGRFNALHTAIHPDWDEGRIYIVSDTDECGLKGSQKLQRLIGGKIILPQTLHGVTQHYWKDIREMYLNEGKEQTKQWLESQL